MIDSSELFVLYKQYESGGKIWLMLGLSNTDSDYDDILKIAECLAIEGHEVKILRAVHYKDPLYNLIFGELEDTRYYRKCPDLWVDGFYVEYESYSTPLPRNAYRNMLHNGLAQSDCIIIRHCNLTDGYMIRTLRGHIHNGVAVSKVWIFNGENLRLLYKTEG